MYHLSNLLDYREFVAMPLVLFLTLLFLAIFTYYKCNIQNSQSKSFFQFLREKIRLNTPLPESGLSINYHFLRLCNYNCKFCFHTETSSFVLSEQLVKQGLRKLHKAKMSKINFSGGEPFLWKNGEFLGMMVRYCKETLKTPCVTVVSNGSKITESWFEKYGKYLDILAISCDSFNPETLERIGRGERGSTKRSHLQQLVNIKNWCSKYEVEFKINTVVCSANFTEDMTADIQELNPMRWKVFQCLLIDGENASTKDLRNAQDMVVTDDQWQQFCRRHSSLKQFVPESNDTMRNSYIILDERMRFLNNQNGKKEPTESILDVGVQKALEQSGFDLKSFLQRSGDFYVRDLEEGYAVGTDCSSGSSSSQRRVGVCGEPSSLEW